MDVKKALEIANSVSYNMNKIVQKIRSNNKIDINDSSDYDKLESGSVKKLVL